MEKTQDVFNGKERNAKLFLRKQTRYFIKFTSLKCKQRKTLEWKKIKKLR